MVMGLFPDIKTIVVLGLFGGLAFFFIAIILGLVTDFSSNLFGLDFSVVAFLVAILVLLAFVVRMSTIEDLKIVPLFVLLAGILIFASLAELFIPQFNFILPVTGFFGGIGAILVVVTSLAYGQVAGKMLKLI